MASDKATGVKVVKETYNDDTGDYLSLEDLRGRSQPGESASQMRKMHRQHVPYRASKPDDLYSYHARATMSRLLGRFPRPQQGDDHRVDPPRRSFGKIGGNRHVIAARHPKSRGGASFHHQHAGNPDRQEPERVDDASLPPRLSRSEEGPVSRPSARTVRRAGQLADQQCRGGLHLQCLPGAQLRKDASGWDDKVHRLLVVMKMAPAAEAPCKLVMDAIGAILAELLNGSAALHELMGPAENLAQALRQLVDLFLGKPGEDARAGLTALAAHIAADDLPEAQTALANRILAELKSNKRLCPESLVDVLMALR